MKIILIIVTSIVAIILLYKMFDILIEIIKINKELKNKLKE